MAFDDSAFRIGGPWGLFWPGCCCGGWEPAEPTCLCMGVAISGLAKGTCDKYGALQNHTHTIPMIEDEIWQCTLSNTCNLCDDETLTLTYDSTTRTWTFTVAGIVWTGEGDRCDSVTLSYVSDTGYLDGSASSVSITPVEDPDCSCWCTVVCEYPCGGAISPYLEVSISGLANSDSNTCTLANGTWVLEWFACGQTVPGCWCPAAAPSGASGYWSLWRVSSTDFDFLGDDPVCDWLDFRIEFYLYYDSDDNKWYIKLNLVPNSQTTGCSGCGYGVYFTKEVTSEIGGIDDGDCVEVDWTFTASDACLLAGSLCCDISNISATVKTL